MEQAKTISRRLVLRAGASLLGVGALGALLTACGANATPTTAPAPAAAASSSAPAAANPGSTVAAQGTPVGVSNIKPPKNPNTTKITWWFGLGGNLGKAIEALTEQFNDSQNEIYVDAIYQGNYDDTLNKYKAGLPGKQTPHLIQVYDVGQRFMVDSQSTEQMQNLIDADKFDTSGFETALLNYYSFGGKLNAMPFNSSTPLLYYNKKLFTEAGLDPTKAPRSWEDVSAAAEKLTKKDSSGKTIQFGMAVPIDGWYFEQSMAAQNAVLLDNDNGRANRATKTFANGENGVKVFEWWKSMLDKGISTNLGRGTTETGKAFAASQIAMTFDSTAALRAFVTNAGDKFEVGTGFLPRPAATLDLGGVVIGGASVYIVKDKPAAEKAATWKFVQWLVQPKQQATWHIATGYYPVRKEAYDLAEVIENTKKYPQFTTAIDQLRASKQTIATSGAVMGPFTQARQYIGNATEETFLGKLTAKAALDKATDDINKALELYNASVK